MTQLHYIAHSAFELSDAGKSVLIDPFITGNPMATLKAANSDSTFTLSQPP